MMSSSSSWPLHLHHPKPPVSSSSRESSSSSSPSSSSSFSFHFRRRLAIAFLFVISNLFRWNTSTALVTPTSSSRSSYHSSSTTSLAEASLPLATAAYAISITSCTSKLSSSLFDAASVLRQSIVLNSWPLHPNSRYGAQFYAFTLKSPPSNDDNGEINATKTTTAAAAAIAYGDECSRLLSLAGWEVLPQDRPVHPELIKEPEGSILKAGIGR